jgi:hypothetical protein
MPVPRISIYIPDEMKADVERLGESINWSSAAQAAFAHEIRRATLPKEDEMEAMIERLRASKAKYKESERTAGVEAGKKWAINLADYEELKLIANLDISDCGDEEGNAWAWVDEHLGNEHPDESFLIDPDHPRSCPSDEYVEGFLEGAALMWDEVADKL